MLQIGDFIEKNFTAVAAIGSIFAVLGYLAKKHQLLLDSELIDSSKSGNDRLRLAADCFKLDDPRYSPNLRIGKIKPLSPPEPPSRRPSPPLDDRGPRAVTPCWAPRRRAIKNFVLFALTFSLGILSESSQAQAFTNVVRCVPYHIHFEYIDGSTQDFAELRIKKSDGYDVRIASYTYLNQLVDAGEVCGENYCVDITSLEDHPGGRFYCVVRDKNWNQGCRCDSTLDTKWGYLTSREITGWCECTIAPW